jgi:hypothetical protein
VVVSDAQMWRPVPVARSLSFTGVMEVGREQQDRRSMVARVLESNERRFEMLDRRGICVAVDAAALLQFYLERIVMIGSTTEFRRIWALNLAGLLKEWEKDPALPVS